MAIYTKTGDKGETGLYGGKRVSKASTQVRAYGAVDELSVALGFVIEEDIDKEDKDFLTDVQRNLYVVMSALSEAPVDLEGVQKHTDVLEKYIDTADARLTPLKRFVLPQGSEEAMSAHQARVVCRRAEREVVEFAHLDSEQEKQGKTNEGADDVKKNMFEVTLKYVNRLSDALFIMARKYNQKQEIQT